MGASDLSAAHQSILIVQQRLAALRDLGVDIAPLGRQLAFAENRLREGSSGDVQAICGDLLETAGRLAHGVAPPSPPLTVAVAAAETALVRQQGQVLAVVDTRLIDFERRVREQFARELAQVIAARPWDRDVRQALASATPVATAGEPDLLRNRLDDLERQVRSLRETLYGGELSSDSGSLPAVQRATHRHAPVTIDGEVPSADRAMVVTTARPVGEDSASATAAAPSASPLQPVAAASSQGAPARSAAADVTPAPSAQLMPATGDAEESPTANELHLLLEIAHQAQDRLASRLQQLEGQIVHLTERLQRAEVVPAALPAPGEIDASWLTRLEADLPSGGRLVAGLPPSGLCTRPETVPPSTRVAQSLTPSPAAAVSGDAATDGPAVSTTVNDSATTKSAGMSGAALEPMTAEQVRRLIDESLTKRMAMVLPAMSGNEALERLSVDQVKALIDESLSCRAVPAVQPAPALPAAGMPAPHTDEEWCERLVQLFPTVVQDPSVRQRLFELIAIESVSRPGVLAELTGMRRLMRRELEAVAQEMRRETAAA